MKKTFYYMLNLMGMIYSLNGSLIVVASTDIKFPLKSLIIPNKLWMMREITRVIGKPFGINHSLENVNFFWSITWFVPRKTMKVIFTKQFSFTNLILKCTYKKEACHKLKSINYGQDKLSSIYFLVPANRWSVHLKCQIG